MAPRLWAPSPPPPPPPFRLRHPHLLPPSRSIPHVPLSRTQPRGASRARCPSLRASPVLSCCAAMLRSSFLPSSFFSFFSHQNPPSPPPFRMISPVSIPRCSPRCASRTTSARCRGDHGEHVAVMDTMKKATMGGCALVGVLTVINIGIHVP